MKISLSLSSKLDKATGTSEILVRFCGGRGMVLRAKSGIYVKPSDWSESKHGIKTISKVSSRDEQHRLQELTKKIDSLCETITKSFVETPKEDINADWLDKVVHDFHNPKTQVEEDLSLFGVFDVFMATLTESSAISTVKMFRTLKRHLFEFSRNLTFDAIDKDLLDDFVGYMQDDSKGGTSYRNSSMQKLIRLLKWFLSWSVENGYNTNTNFKLYKPRFKNPQKLIIFLDKDELESVKTHDFSRDERLDKVRDVFVFCCYTGLRYSDVENLKRSNIYDDKLHITTVKTADAITINLNNVSRSILEKYSECDFARNRALPVISNQKMNDALKEMAKQCGIDKEVTSTYYIGSKRYDETKPKYELISTHAGRRTFVCTALSLGIAPQVVMKWTGHSDYQSMKPYIDITEKAKSESMALFDK